MTNNKYSVYMPVYFKEKAECLKKSVDTLLNQTLPPSEFVIVEDGKLTDELYKIIDNFVKEYPDIFKIIVLPENVGSGEASRIAVINCTNDYIVRMDSDDISMPNRCELEMKFLKEHSDYDMVGSNTAEFINDITNIISSRTMPETNEDIIKFAKKRCPYIHTSMMMKKSMVLKAGNYENRRFAEDYDLWVRMIQAGAKGYNIQENLVYMRANETFYARRGGKKVLKDMLSLRKKFYRSKFISFPQYMEGNIIHTVVCYMPDGMRTWFYKTFLRDKDKK